MPMYTATVMDAQRGSEGKYDFELPDQIEKLTPMKVVRLFMEHVDHDLFPKEHVEYECNAAFRSKDRKIVTALGVLHFEHGELPFMMMVAAKA